MNLEIYDIEYKKDYLRHVLSTTELDQAEMTYQYNDPIQLIKKGLTGKTFSDRINNENVNVYSVSTSNEKLITDRTLVPSESYMFNICCKIVRKHKFRLQPGSSMTHIFISRPKNMLSRGYLGYNFDQVLSTSSTTDDNVSVRNLTCGCLFKFWGQISGTGSTINGGSVHVAGLSPKLMIREDYEAKWYCMDDKFTYTFREDNSWTPTTEQLNSLEVVNNMNLQSNKEMDTDNTNNQDPTTSGT